MSLTVLRIQGDMKGLLGTHLHRFATLWRIEREDTAILRFTDHDTELPYTYDPLIGEEVYVPAGGFSATAREKQAGIRDHNLETVGVISSAYITDDDLRVGKYNNAKVVELLVDYRFPYGGPFQQNTYWITNLSYNRETWHAQVSAQPVWLRKEIGTVLTHTCRFKLGEGICGQGVDLEALRVSAIVTAVDADERRRVFTIDHTNTANYWQYGEVTWTAGFNASVANNKHDVAEHPGSGSLELCLETPYNITVGDTLTIVPGCDKLMDTCHTKFNNVVNFGGYPSIPGTDKVVGGLIP